MKYKVHMIVRINEIYGSYPNFYLSKYFVDIPSYDAALQGKDLVTDIFCEEVCILL